MFKTTPDLSEFKGTFEKTFKAKKQPKPIKPGKKTKAWEADRNELKEIFKNNGVTKCEIKFKIPKCFKDNFLGFAHTRRRVTLTAEQIGDAHYNVLACQSCHNEVDFVMKKEKAEKILDRIVKNRGW